MARKGRNLIGLAYAASGFNVVFNEDEGLHTMQDVRTWMKSQGIDVPVFVVRPVGELELEKQVVLKFK